MMTASTTTTSTPAGVTDAAAAASATEVKIIVWDLPTRIFHWSLALSFAGAFISGDSERWRDLHLIFGYTLLGLIVFRLVWGLVGSRYARFSSFVSGPARVKSYLASLLTRRPQHHVGHNPAGGLAIVLLLAFGLVISLTGLATYNEIGGESGSEWFEEIHEGAANAMLALIAIHIAGVLLSSLLHGENLLAAMLNGRKRGQPEQGIGSPRRLVAMLLVLTMLLTWAVWVDKGPAALPGLGGGLGGSVAAMSLPFGARDSWHDGSDEAKEAKEREEYKQRDGD